jgi:hypothetical protein
VSYCQRFRSFDLPVFETFVMCGELCRRLIDAIALDPQRAKINNNAQNDRKPDSERITSWTDVPLDIKMQFFNVWALFSIFSSVFLIASAAFGILSAVGLEGKCCASLPIVAHNTLLMFNTR